MDRIFPTTDVHPSSSALPTEPGACEPNTVGWAPGASEISGCFHVGIRSTRRIIGKKAPKNPNLRPLVRQAWVTMKGHGLAIILFRECSFSSCWKGPMHQCHQCACQQWLLTRTQKLKNTNPFLRMQLQNCSLLGIIKGGPCKLNNLWDKFHIPKRRSACFLAAVTPADAERRAHSAAVAIDTTLFKSFTTSSASVPWKVGVHWRELQFSVGNSGDSIIQDSEKTHLKNKQLLVGKISLISAIFLFVASITYRCENIIKAKLSTRSRSATRSNQKIAR